MTLHESECRKLIRDPFVQCDCYIHDRVAELLNIPSTRANGWKPQANKALQREVDHLLPSAHPPRPRKPKTTSNAELIQASVKAARVAKGASGPTYHGHWTATPKPQAAASGPRGPYSDSEIEEIFEWGKTEPVARIRVGGDPVLEQYLDEDG